MTSSALLWFVDLCTHYAPAPIEAQELGKDIQKQLSSAHDRTQVNRAFKRRIGVLPAIHAWLTGPGLVGAISKKNCALTSSAHVTAISAIYAIIGGQVASSAWGMNKQRGVNTGFSTTHDAAALVGYLTKITSDDWLPDVIYSKSEDLSDEYLLLAYVFQQRGLCSGPLFSQATALKIASVLFGVHEDNIRKYSGIQPVNAQSEAVFAVLGLFERRTLSKANDYFDVDDLLALL